MAETNGRIENNNARLTGKVVDEYKFSHEVYGEAFYATTVEVNRLSGSVDEIPITVSERLVDVSKSPVGEIIEVKGQFRSYNRHNSNGTSNLVLSLFVRELRKLEESETVEEDNRIELDGYICKTPVFRITPSGREIADVLIAVNRTYGKSDYIPCICWGRNAKFINKLEVGTHIKTMGRMQSRHYIKKLPDAAVEMIAYEVSLSKIETVNDDIDVKE